MNKVINVLIKLASDASINNQAAITEIIEAYDMTMAQKNAIVISDSSLLANFTAELPELTCFPIFVPDENELTNCSARINDLKKINY